MTSLSRHNERTATAVIQETCIYTRERVKKLFVKPFGLKPLRAYQDLSKCFNLIRLNEKKEVEREIS